MPEYTIQAVAPEPRKYSTKFGDMASYKVKFTTEADTVEISQKEATPAPKPGDTLNGTITETEYGKKFKKDFAGGGSGFKSGVSKAPSDPFTMYLSYAKDIAVALIPSTKEPKYTDIIDQVLVGAYALYNGRPEATAGVSPTKDAEPLPEEPGDSGDLDEIDWA